MKAKPNKLEIKTNEHKCRVTSALNDLIFNIIYRSLKKSNPNY